jgi:hypothetical protein
MTKYVYAWFRGMSLSWNSVSSISNILSDLYSIISEYDPPYIEIVFKRLDELSDIDLKAGDHVLLIVTNLNPFGVKAITSYFDRYNVLKNNGTVYLVRKRNREEKYRGIYVVHNKERVLYDTLDPLRVLYDIKNRFGNERIMLIKVAYLGTNMDILRNKRGYKKIIIVTPIRFLINEDMVRQVFGQEYNIEKLSKHRGYLLTRKENLETFVVKSFDTKPSF